MRHVHLIRVRVLGGLSTHNADAQSLQSLGARPPRLDVSASGHIHRLLRFASLFPPPSPSLLSPSLPSPSFCLSRHLVRCSDPLAVREGKVFQEQRPARNESRFHSTNFARNEVNTLLLHFLASFYPSFPPSLLSSLSTLSSFLYTRRLNRTVCSVQIAAECGVRGHANAADGVEGAELPRDVPLTQSSPRVGRRHMFG